MTMTQTGSGSPEARSPGALDLLNIDALLSNRELEVRDHARSFVEDEIKPSISEWWEEAHSPRR